MEAAYSYLQLLIEAVQPEQDRLDFQHAGFMRLTGWKYAFAPMTEEPKIVLDVATGTGIWVRSPLVGLISGTSNG